MSVSIVAAKNYDEKTIKNAFENAFNLMGFDASNPLKDIVKPGDSVFIKPNWVSHQYRASCPSQHSVYSTITHPLVLKVMVDYVAIALKNEGEIVLGDNPSIDADFDKLLNLYDFKVLLRIIKFPLKF